MRRWLSCKNKRTPRWRLRVHAPDVNQARAKGLALRASASRLGLTTHREECARAISGRLQLRCSGRAALQPLEPKRPVGGARPADGLASQTAALLCLASVLVRSPDDRVLKGLRSSANFHVPSQSESDALGSHCVEEDIGLRAARIPGYPLQIGPLVRRAALPALDQRQLRTRRRWAVCPGRHRRVLFPDDAGGRARHARRGRGGERQGTGRRRRGLWHGARHGLCKSRRAGGRRCGAASGTLSARGGAGWS